MITKITIKQAKAAIEDYMTSCVMMGYFSLHNDPELERYRAIRVYGIFECTYKILSSEGLDPVIDELRKEGLELSEEEKALLIVSPVHRIGMEKIRQAMADLGQISPQAQTCLQLTNMNGKEEDEKDGEDSITVIIYREGVPRPRFSEIRRRYQDMLSAEKRETKSLKKEFDREGDFETLAAITEQEYSDMLAGHHLLWHGAAASNTSSSVIVDQLKQDILSEKKKYDVSGMLLFIYVDKDFSTMSEVLALRDGFASLLGQDVDVSLNINVDNSYVKTISCRVYLIGNPKYSKGEVYMDFGRLEVLLYQSEDAERGHMVVASYEDEELTLSRYDWGDYERNDHGQTDTHHYFDKENTGKLCHALHVKRPETLLRRLKLRFGHHAASSADYCIRQFCKDNGITFHSEYYY